jgi:hypothetical protein
MPKLSYTATKGLVSTSGSGIDIEKANATCSSNAATANGSAGIITTEVLTVTAGNTSALQTITNNRVNVNSTILLTAEVAADNAVGAVPVAHIVAISANQFTFKITNIKGAGGNINKAVKVHYIVL